MSTILELSKLPKAVVIEAYTKLIGPIPANGLTRVEINEELARAIGLGLFTLNAVRTSGRGIPPAVGAPPANWKPLPPALDVRPQQQPAQPLQSVAVLAEVEVAQQVANAAAAKAQQVANDVNAAIARIQTQVNSVAGNANQARSDSASLLNRVAGVEVALAMTAEEIKAHGDKVLAQVEALGKQSIDPALIETKLGQMISAAFKPFEALVRSTGSEATVRAAAAQPVDRKSAREVFGIDVKDSGGQQVMVDLWGDPAAPAIDPNHVWEAQTLAELLLAQDEGMNVWMGGEKGSGKTQTAQQFAAFTGRRFVRINFHKDSTTEDYAGGRGLQQGSTVFEPGPFLEGYEHPGAVILLDEPSNTHPAELATLNGFLEPGARVTYGGAVRRRAPGVMVMAADNTLGNGDSGGRYAGTRPMNSALMDRFSLVIPFTHMSAAREVDALCRHTGAPQPLVEHVVSMINAARAKTQTGDLIDAPSIRRAMAFLKALRRLSVDRAWTVAIATVQPDESAAGLEAIRTAHLDATKIKALLKGWK